jgi:hypothetical protein
MAKTGTGIVGLDTVVNNLEKKIAQAGKGSAKGLFAAGTFVMQKAQKDAPVMHGHLRRSAFVDKPVDEPGIGSVVAFGFRTPYAIKTHENPRSGKTGGVSPRGRRYSNWARKGRAFYLYRNLKKYRRKIVDIVNGAAQTEIKSR